MALYACPDDRVSVIRPVRESVSSPSLRPARGAGLLQLSIRPLPQLLCQPVVLCLGRHVSWTRHGVVKGAALDALCRRARPQLIAGALLHRCQEEADGRQQRVRQPGMRLLEAACDGRHDGPRVDRGGEQLRVAAREAAGEEDVCQLGLPVAAPRCRAAHLGLELRKYNALLRCEIVAMTCHDNDAGRSGRRSLCGGGEESRQKELGEEGVALVVGAELELIAVGCEPGRVEGDAGVEEEDVETCGLRGEGGGGFVDAVKGREVELDDCNARVRDGGFDLFDCGLGSRAGARCKPDRGWIVQGELFDGLCAKTRVSCRGASVMCFE